MKEINPVTIIKTIEQLLRKFYGSESEPKVTLLAYYKADMEITPPVANFGVDKHQHEMCHRLIVKMVDTKAQTSQQFNEKSDEQVGAISTEGMIIAMAGIESIEARAIIAKSLKTLCVLSDEEYYTIQVSIGQPNIFVKLGDIPQAEE